ncbi:DUF333 domain-containing protein [Candidatus Pacearchaeota archaeon]|nr:DUF333 domain-containing protein [Candidatus Pacearchaeota archaeon]
MYYLVSPCNQEDKGVFANITIEENKVILHQKVSYVCCANITLSYEVYDGILVINEDNKGEICKCICNYEIFAQINESGITEVKVYGIFYPDVHPYDLLGESSVENQTLANPASVFCEEQGGTLEIRENTEGQYGVCIFSSGKECEEWAFFRGECSAS